MKTTRTILALILLPCGLAAQTPSAPAASPGSPGSKAAPADPAQDLQAKQQELATVAQQLEDIQARAEQAEPVKAKKQEYRDALKTEMVRSAPEKEEKINRQAELVDELTAAKPDEAKDTDAALKERSTKLAEYRPLHEELTPVEAKVQDADTVKSTRKVYFDQLVAEMEKIEPKTPELLARHRELTGMIRELSARASSG